MNLAVTILLVLLALVSTLGAGLELELKQLGGASTIARVLAGPLIANVLIIPAATWGLLCLMNLPSDAAEALLLVAAAPGGASSPLLARLAGGDAVRVGLTYVALATGGVVTLPILLPIIAPGAAVGTPMLAFVTAVQLLPLAVGMFVRSRWSSWAARTAPKLRAFGTLLLGGVVVLLAVTRGSLLPSLGVGINVALVLAVGISLTAGGLLSPRPRLPDAQLACVRNLTLALMVAEAQRPGGRGTLIIAAYGLVMYIAVFAAGRAFRARYSSEQDDEQGTATEPT